MKLRKFCQIVKFTAKIQKLEFEIWKVKSVKANCVFTSLCVL